MKNQTVRHTNNENKQWPHTQTTTTVQWLRVLVPITVRSRCWLLCINISKTIAATNMQLATL